MSKIMPGKISNSKRYASFFVFSALAGFFCEKLPVEAASAAPAMPAASLYAGEELDFQVPCVAVSAEVDAGLTKGVRVQGNLPKNVAIMVAKDEAQRRILVRANECVPNAHLTLRLPQNFTLLLHDSPKMSLGVKGTLESFEGSLIDGDNVALERVDSLDLKMSGASKLSVEKLHRAAQLIAGDKASFICKEADLSAFSVFVSGQADILMHSGHIGSAHLTMSDDGQAQVFAAVGHADVRTKDRAFVRLGSVSQAPEMADGSILRKEETPVGSVVISQPDVVVPPPSEAVLSPVAADQPASAVKAETAQASAELIQPAVTAGGQDIKDGQVDSDIQPAPGFVPTATPPVAAKPAEPLSQKTDSVKAFESNEKTLKEEIKKEKAEQKAAKKDEKRMAELQNASVTAPSSLMVS